MLTYSEGSLEEVKIDSVSDVTMMWYDYMIAP